MGWWDSGKRDDTTLLRLSLDAAPIFQCSRAGVGFANIQAGPDTIPTEEFEDFVSMLVFD
jgi:hypothetical protein